MSSETTTTSVGEAATEATDTAADTPSPPPPPTVTSLMDLGELPISQILQFCNVKELATLHMCCKTVLHKLICREYKRRDAILRETYRHRGRASSNAAVVGLSRSKTARHRVIRYEIAKEFADRMEELQAKHGVMEFISEQDEGHEKYQEECCRGCQEFPNLDTSVIDENERNDYEFFIRITSEASDLTTARIQGSAPLILFQGFVPLMLRSPVGLYLDGPIQPGSTVTRREYEGDGDYGHLIEADMDFDRGRDVLHLNLRDTSFGQSTVEYKTFAGLRITVVAVEHGWNRREQACGKTLSTISCPPMMSLPPKLVVTTTNQACWDADEIERYTTLQLPVYSGEAWCVPFSCRATESHRRSGCLQYQNLPVRINHRGGVCAPMIIPSFFVQDNHTVSFSVVFMELAFEGWSTDDSEDDSEDDDLEF